MPGLIAMFQLALSIMEKQCYIADPSQKCGRTLDRNRISGSNPKSPDPKLWHS